jgi:hypothetical protein
VVRATWTEIIEVELGDSYWGVFLGDDRTPVALFMGEDDAKAWAASQTKGSAKHVVRQIDLS